jgi:hypothetical protein
MITMAIMIRMALSVNIAFLVRTMNQTTAAMIHTTMTLTHTMMMVNPKAMVMMNPKMMTMVQKMMTLIQTTMTMTYMTVMAPMERPRQDYTDPIDVPLCPAFDQYILVVDKVFCRASLNQ